jgi:small subunit ribosomal protein S20
MPILSSAKKALRSSERTAAVNRLVKAQLKTALDKVKAKPAADSLSNAFSRIDKAVKRNLMHKNKAARLKSQTAKLVK